MRRVSACLATFVVILLLPAAAAHAQAPQLTAVSPTSGSSLGGQTITLLGSNFVPGTTVTFGGVAAPSASVISATQIFATTPAHAPGLVSVAVTNGNGSSTLPNSFTFIQPPLLSAVSPPQGPTAGGTAVTLTGSGFTTGTSARFGGVLASSVVIVSSTTITCLTPAGPAGPADVQVSNANGVNILPGAFTYLPPPTITSVAPQQGPASGGTSVTIQGTGFTAGASVTFGGQPAASTTFVSATQLTAVTAARAPGTVAVGVSGSAGSTSLPGAFTFMGSLTLTGVSPATGGTSGQQQVLLFGTNFTPATSVTFGGVPALAVDFDSTTQLTVETPPHAEGVVSIVATNENGTATLPGAFTYGSPAPQVSSVTPASGTPLGGTTVSIQGSSFTGSTSVTFGGIAATGVLVVSATQIQATAPSHAPGSVTVAVTNANGTGSLPNGFTYLSPPSIASLNPTTGTSVGGTTVSITGSHFTASTVVLFGGVAAPAVTFVSGSTLQAVTPTGSGTVAVSVSNANGSASLPGAFTYVQAPSIASVNPDSGVMDGGTLVTITGNGFVPGTTVTFGGVAATSVTVNSLTSIQALTPPHATGLVSVEVANANGASNLPSGYLYLSENLMQITNASAQPGSSVALVVRLTNENPISGYTTVCTFDPTLFQLTAVNVTGLDVTQVVGPVAPPGGNGGIEFFATSINNVQGYGTGSALFDLNPPFQAQKLPAGGPRSVMRYQFSTTNNPALLGTTHAVRLENNVGSPPLSNVLSETGFSVFPQLVDGSVTFVDLPGFKRGDANGDGIVNIADAIFVINFLFTSGPAPGCMIAANMNGDSVIDISDIIFNVSFQFSGGPAPPPPFPDCGVESSASGLSCLSYPGC